MICYVLAMGKRHLGPHVVVGYGIKIFLPGLFITSPDHLNGRRMHLSDMKVLTRLGMIRDATTKQIQLEHSFCLLAIYQWNIYSRATNIKHTFIKCPYESTFPVLKKNCTVSCIYIRFIGKSPEDLLLFCSVRRCTGQNWGLFDLHCDYMTSHKQDCWWGLWESLAQASSIGNHLLFRPESKKDNQCWHS